MEKEIWQLKEEIKELIINDKLSLAVGKMKHFYKKDNKQLNLIDGRIRTLERDSGIGVIRYDDNTIERNKLRRDLLLLLDTFIFESDGKKNSKKNISAHIKNNYKLIFIVFGFFLVILLSRNLVTIDSIFLRILLYIVFGVFSLQLGYLYGMICFYGEIVETKMFVNPEENPKIFYILSLFILGITYFAYDPVVTLMSYVILLCFIFNLLMATIGIFIYWNYDDNRTGEFAFKISYFTVINCVLYYINHPVSVKVINHFDKGISHLIYW